MIMHREREMDMRAQAVVPAAVPERVANTEDEYTTICGSYGCGIYAGHSTFGLDYYHQGRYGRGMYAGHSTFDLDFDSPGSYGRGIYAGHTTYGLDFRRKDNYARGMEQPLAHVAGQQTRAVPQRTQQ
jgi:hypothetical protein